MTSPQEVDDVTGTQEEPCEKPKELEIDSLHKRRRGEPPASLAVNAASSPSDAEGSTPCTAGLTPEDVWIDHEDSTTDPDNICDVMIKKLQDRTDVLSERGKNVATSTKNTFDALDQLDKLLELVDQIVSLKEKNMEILRKLRDINQLKQMHDANMKIILDTKRIKAECKELQMINEVLDSEFDADYAQGEALLESILTGTRSLKRTGSKWRGHSKFGGSLLRKQRSRSTGGDDSDVPMTPLRRRSEGISCKEVDKSKVSKWTRVKAAFRWEKAQQWPPPMGTGIAGAAGAVAAGALVGAVALAGSAPAQNNASTEPTRDSASLTPGSLLSLTPNSSCEELRLDSGSCRKSSVLRCEDVDNFLHAPTQDDSSTSPSPNKLHKSAWGKMREIIQTRRDSVRKKTSRSTKSSPDVVPARRRSFSDGGDSDAPPVLTLTIPSSEELESEASHPLLRKQRSLELGAARPPQHRSPRASKWSKVKRAFLTSASASVPSSPNRHSAFFTDADTEGLSSGCEASAVRDEIARDYAALQSRLGREFSDRRGKLYAASRPVATEEQLSTDFRKKLAEWQKMKGGATRQPPPIPARKDLSEDFLKKWDEWKRMKETNSVPAWGEDVKPEEVQVQTSTGLFKFQGISRSFTRKLHEWEKSRGIAPEASTSALLQAARTNNTRGPQTQLIRTQSDGSVGPSPSGSGRLHASSLSVNDADDFDLEFDRDNNSIDGEDVCDGDSSRGALLVEVEADEICTAAPLMAVSPKHTPQKPIYTYDNAEARLLCETSAAITGTAFVQPNNVGIAKVSNNVELSKKSSSKSKTAPREQSRSTEKTRRKLVRQPSIEDDAKFIRKSIEEIEKDNAIRNKDDNDLQENIIAEKLADYLLKNNNDIASTSTHESLNRINDFGNNNNKGDDKSNGKKKTKSRARLEREQSKPSESDTERDVDTVTVEIPKRRKRPRRVSEKPRTPPTSIVSDSEGEIYVLKLKPPDENEGSPEVIVKTTRKIFSPVVRSGETIPRAVIPVDVDDLADVRSPDQPSRRAITEEPKRVSQSLRKTKSKDDCKASGSGDLFEGDEQRPKSRPPLPLSPSSQRRPQLKETAPSIRIMIQRYNMKIKEEEGHTSGASSGTSSPAWRSPALERRRPPDMPVGVNIRNNPFVEREVQKSVSACQLSSKKDQHIEEKTPIKISSGSVEGVLKSRSAGAIHPFNCEDIQDEIPAEGDTMQLSKETVNLTASTDTIVPDLTLNTPDVKAYKKSEVVNVLRQMSDSAVPNLTKVVSENAATIFGRSVSEVVPPKLECVPVVRCSERTKRIREARERFLSSPGPPRIRRQGIGSANDLRPGDRSSRISCESDVVEGSNGARALEDNVLGRSASTGMVNVERETWERVAEVNRRENRSPRSRFSLARLAAKLRRKDEGAVSRLCRQSLLVQLKK